MEVINALGRRKSAVARIFMSEGTGKITINKKDLAVYFPSSILQFVVKQPLNKLGVVEKYDIKKKDPAWLPGDGACNDRRLPSGYLRQQRPLRLMCGWQ